MFISFGIVPTRAQMRSLLFKRIINECVIIISVWNNFNSVCFLWPLLSDKHIFMHPCPFTLSRKIHFQPIHLGNLTLSLSHSNSFDGLFYVLTLQSTGSCLKTILIVRVFFLFFRCLLIGSCVSASNSCTHKHTQFYRLKWCDPMKIQRISTFHI